MGKSVRNTDGGLPGLDTAKPMEDDGDQLPGLKKKEPAGSVSPSDSLPNTPATEPPVGTSASDPKQVTANFKNNSLTPKDIGGQPLGKMLGPSPDQISHAINNKGKNIEKWEKAPSDNYVTSLVNQHNDIQGKVAALSQQQELTHQKNTPEWNKNQGQLTHLQESEKYLRGQIQKEYDARKPKLVSELVGTLKEAFPGANWVDVYNNEKKEADGTTDIVAIDMPLIWDKETNKLTPKSVKWVEDHIDPIMNKKKDAAVNAVVSGNLDDKPRTYADLSKAVVDQLNLVPVQKAQQDFTEDFIKRNPSMKDALSANKDIHDYFSKNNFDDVNAKVKVQADKEFIETQERYFGKDGLFQKNQDYVGIQHKYAELVGGGKMSESVAKKQMEYEINEHPELKKIKQNFETEKRKVIEGTQKQFENYVIGGLKKEHPQYTTYKDGTIGLASLSEDQYNKMMKGYHEGLDKVAKKMMGDQEAASMAQANKKAKSYGPLLGSLVSESNELAAGLTKMIFNKTGWGGGAVRNFQADEIAGPGINQSDVAATWNFKGWESLLRPNFYLSGVGKMVPVIAGGAAVSFATEGEAVPGYVEWLANAGLFTAQTSLSTYNQLLNTKDGNGNMLTESDAAHFTADQAKKDFLPNVLMMAVGSGTLLRAKNIVKPTIGRAIGRGAIDLAAQQPFFAWQGYNDYATMQEATGKKTDIYDYLQSKDFRDNLVNGMIMGGAFSLLHAPGNYMRSMDNWTKMVHTSEGEFKNLIPQNYALGQEMEGNGNYLRDALKLHTFNIDPEGLNEQGKRQLSDLKNQLLYSVNLDRNIKIGNLDPKNIQDLYQAHNLSLADQHEYLSEQAAKEGNKTLSDVYKDKAKDYREQAKNAANGEAKYHYLVNDEGHPIFMSDKSFKTLEQEGTIAKWQEDGTIKGVHKSDDQEFAQRYKDFVTAKSEATVEGTDIMDHAKGLIEENKDRLGTTYGVAKENPELFYKEISDQVHGINADGSSSLRPDAEQAARDHYGDDIVDMAKVMYPVEEKQKEAASAPAPEEKVKAEPVSQGEYKPNIRDDYFAQSDFFTPEEKEKFAGLDEAGQDKMIDDKRAELKGSPEDNIPVSEMMGKPVIYKGKKGMLVEEGQATVFKPEDGGKEYELGNTKELGDQSAKGLGIGTEKSVVDADAEGDFTVRGKKYINPFEKRGQDPTDAILYDKDGNVVNVRMKTPEGERRTFTGPVAEDLAYQIHLKQISDNHEQPALEEFINSDEPTRKEIEDGGLTAASEEKTTVDPEKVSGEPDKEVTKPSPIKKGKDEVPPPPPPPKPREPMETPKEEFTAVRKEKLAEIKGVRKMFDRQKVVGWTETYDNAMADVQASYPELPIYDGMRARTNEFVTKLDNGVLFNPTSEDIATFNVFKNETIRRISEIQGWDSDDLVTRLGAAAEFAGLHNDLFNVARVTNPGGEAGRAFNMLQSEVAIDPEYGLKIRRMELGRGRKLSEKEMEFTADNWDKEKKLYAEIQKAKDAKTKEVFQKKLDDVKADYEKRLKEARAEKKPPSEKEKREKLLSQKGATLAEKIRSGKLKGTYATFPGLPQAINVVIEGIAKLVEGGYTLAQAIDEYVQANKIKNKDQFQNDLFEVFNKQERQEDVYGQIEKMAKASGTTDVTKEMAGQNLIRDYMNAHVGLHDSGEVLDIVHAELKKVLPDLEKDRLIDAYLKQGDFKQATKQELEGGFKQSQKNFDRLVKLEKDINELNEKKDLHKKSTNKNATPYDKEVLAKEKEKKDIMNSMGIKTSGEDKYTKASYDQRAKSHNDRLDALSKDIQSRIEKGDLPANAQKALLKLKAQLDASTIKIDPTSAISQSKTLDGGLDILKGIKSEFKRESMDDISKVGDVNRSMQKIIDKFGSDKDATDQDMKLQRAKDKAKRDAEDYLSKIAKGEFEDKTTTPLTKTDAELIKLERDRAAFDKLYQDKKRDFEKGQKNLFSRIADFGRAIMVDWLIGSPMTLLRVAGSAVARPGLETITKLTFGKGFAALPFETTKAITERAKAGGEGLSLEGIQGANRAYFKQYTPEQIKGIYDKANDAYEKLDKEYQQAKANMPENELAQLKEKRDNALVSALSTSMYEFIAGSSLKEGLSVLMHRSTQMERQFGDFDSESWKKAVKDETGREKLLRRMDNTQYIVNFVGRAHAAEKNFSARFSFANGFISRLEYAVKNGVDISHPDKILEIAHESYFDWEKGKYQESNWITDGWNSITNALEKLGGDKNIAAKSGKVLGTSLAYLMRSDIAITRVPVNMIREGVLEYTVGAITGSVMAAREYLKAKKIVLQDGYTEKGSAEFKQELSEQLQKIDPEKAATILRSFRKGGFGLGLYALAALGHAAFGGWAHKGQTAEDAKKKKREAETGVPELETGGIQVGDYKFPEWASKVIEHTPAFYPLGFGLGLAKVYGNNIADGRSDVASATNSIMAQVNHLINSIPQAGVYTYFGGQVLDRIKPSSQWDDVDQDGNPMKRHAFSVADHFKYITFGGHTIYGDKKDELSESYYKQAVSTQRNYRQQITEVETNTSLSKKDKEEQRESLLKELDEAIADIYKSNKEDPQ